VADYAAALLYALRQHGDVRADASTADVHLYHIGNNQLHGAIYRRAIEQSGVTVLHDAVLQHFFLGSSTEAQYVDEFVYNYGEWHRDRGHQLWRDRAASATDERYFRYPMLRRVAERSLAVVVHNPGAADLVRRHAADIEIVTIPHLFDAPPPLDPVSAFDFRRRLGIPLDHFLFGVFGFLRESKRLLHVLEVFAEVRKANPRIGLLVAGDIISSDLERACAPLLERPGVYRVPYLSDHDFWIAASAIDACINLRVPPAGETSGIAIRMMGLGKAVILTDSPENAAFPKGTFFPVPSGVAERTALFDYICILAQDPMLGREMGRMASAHVSREHSIARVSSLFWDLLCKNAACSSRS
jgi:glycosyltransferase involved in cell wall biosynthesis